ncbi:lytic transglycosylase domain-containing protein [Marivita sp. S2033]|uniref:lytic murein transglycosylase n=1 Tax=Marivita sp. S2033 TaxID=3373187 RepID=UPI0039825963
MRRLIAAALMTACAALPVSAAQCITSQSDFNAYKQNLANQAAAAGVGQRGLAALQAANLSGITWRFESNPSSQSGTLQGDPARFLAKRSGSTADSFINQTRSKIAKNPNTFASIERNFGVPGSILATIWGLETSWGGYLGGTDIVDGAVTLSSYCRRHPRFEPHAIAALQMVDDGTLSPGTQGGPSGELGHMQFLAGNWMKYRVDGNGDGRADPYNAVDALATAANMLRRNGWQAGQPFGEGTQNFNVLSVWNDSGNYLRAIVYSAERAGG